VRRIALTGASSGIGAALAERLAGPGVSMLLTGRDGARLDRVAAAARARGAAVETVLVDVTDRPSLSAALLAFDAAAPIDLLIANAGISAGLGPGRTPEDPAEARRVWEVNYGGVLNTVEPLLPAFLARGAGRIVLMSSMAARRPLADMPSYSASKAAVRAYGESLRGWLGPRGVAVTVLCPGFVTSPMSARHRGFKPFEITADRAADIIARGVARRAPFVTFPWPLALICWLDRRLPPRLADRLAAGFAAEITPEDAPPDRT
jgi:short-subunit dehydrogenase